MLGPRDLVLCAGTLPRASFEERVAAAAEGGFSAISLFISDYERARAEGKSDADLRAVLAHAGIAVAELDPLLRWLPGAALAASANEQGASFFRHTEDEFYAVAEAVGARSINVVSVTDTALATEEFAAAFAGVCDRAAERGLLVHLEFLPWTQIRDAATALEIVELAGRPNGGLMFDTWHHFRSGTDDERLRAIPGERILAVQINDAPREAEDDPIEETMRRRLLPGEGAIDLVGIARILDEQGAPAPIGVEIFSDALAALPAKEVARRAGDAARAVLARARGGTPATPRRV